MSAENQDALAYNSGSSGRTTIADYVSVVKRRKWWVLGPVLLAVGLTLMVSLTSTTLYRASATVLVTDPPKVAGGLPESLSARSYRNELNRAQSLPVRQEARKQIGSEPALSATSGGGNTDLFLFIAESRSAERAAKAANAYAQAYAKARGEVITDSLNSQIEGIDSQIEDTQEELDALPDQNSPEAEELKASIVQLQAERGRVQRVINGKIASNTKVLDPATKPRSPFTPRPVRDAITALILGLVAGLVLAFIVDALDQKLRTVRDTERATLLPVLSVVGHLRRWRSGETHLVLAEAPASPQAEAFRALRAKIQFRRMDEPLQSVLITSAEPGDGKSSTAANLALAFAAVGDDTVVVDLDLRRPTLHDYLGLPNGPGAASVLSGGDYKGIYQTVPSVPNLTFVSAGKSRIDASELLAGERLGQFLSVLTERFETVIVDSPPILAVVDPLSIAQYCDGVLMVVSAGTTDGRKARSAADQLSDALAPTLGVVLNNYTESGSGYGYSYDYEVVDNYVPEREPNSTLEDNDQPEPVVPAATPVPANRIVRTTPPTAHEPAVTGYSTGEWAVEEVLTADVTNPGGVPRPSTIESSPVSEQSFVPQSAVVNIVRTEPPTGSIPAVGGSPTGPRTGQNNRVADMSELGGVGHGQPNSGWSDETGAQYIGTLFDQNSKQARAESTTGAPAATAAGPTGLSPNAAANGVDATGAVSLSVTERQELLLGALIVPESVVDLPLTEAPGIAAATIVTPATTEAAGSAHTGIAIAAGDGRGFEPLSPEGGRTNTSPTGLSRDENDEWEVLTEEQMLASIRSDLAEAIRERRALGYSDTDQDGADTVAADDPTPASPPSTASSKNRRKRRL